MKIYHALLGCLVSSIVFSTVLPSPAICQVKPLPVNFQLGNNPEAQTDFNYTNITDRQYIHFHTTLFIFIGLILPAYLNHKSHNSKHKIKNQDNDSLLSAKKRGKDLEIDLAVSFFEAIFGCQKEIIISRLECGFDRKLTKVTKLLKVKIPAGGDCGSKIRLRSQGDVSENGGHSGDLYIRLLVPSQEGELKRSGTNIESEINITEQKAQAGCTFVIRTIEGDREIVVSPRTRHRDCLVLRGCGVSMIGSPSEKGDHIIHFNIKSMNKIRGDDLSMYFQIDFHEAIYGCEKEIDFLHLESEVRRKLKQVPKSLKVTIPAGVDTGTKLRIGGQGDGSDSGGEPGDLYIHLIVRDRERGLKRNGINIESEIMITEAQAQVGCECAVEMLDGEKRILISPGSKHGDYLTLKGCGVPKLGNTSERGDHIIQFHVICSAPDYEGKNKDIADPWTTQLKSI